MLVMLPPGPTTPCMSQRNGKKVVWRHLLVFLAAITAGYGCVAAAVGAGAASAVYFTSRGTESTLGRPIDDVAAKTKDVLAQNGIAIDTQSTKNGGDHREYDGKKSGLDVTVSLSSEGPKLTKVEVSAKKNLVEWDKDFAKQIVDQIIAKA